jgi:phosphoribosylglycinamide formyltransferase-1
MKRKMRIGALISGSGTNLQAILDACRAGRISAEVCFIGSDNPSAAGLARGRRTQIPTFVVDYDRILERYRCDPAGFEPLPDFDLQEIRRKQALVSESVDTEMLDHFLRSRALVEAALLEQMQRYSYDLVVCAGFMRKLTPYFIDRVNLQPGLPRIMNIHPALLPAFPGTDGYGDTLRFGCKVGGCTVHFIDYGEDTGPIIGQRAFAIEEQDTLETVKQKGLQLEWELYPHCIDLFARGRLRVEQQRHHMKNGEIFERKVVHILPESSSI